MNIGKILIKSIATFLYLGYLPLAPGTCASIAGVFLFYALRNNPHLYILLAGFITLLGFLVSGRAEDAYGRKDARFIVIDEVSGMLLSLLFIPYDLRLAIGALVLFRIFDIAKPWPGRQAERLKGSLGVMADDLVAAIYTNIILQLFLRFASFKAS